MKSQLSSKMYLSAFAKAICTCMVLCITATTSIAQVDFTPDVNNGCPPLLVNCTNNTHLSMDTTKATFYWYFEGPGDTVIDDSTYDASFTYLTPGNYEIRLAMYDSFMVYQGDFMQWITYSQLYF